MNATETITRGRLELRRIVSPYPRIFVPLMRMRSQHDGHVVDADTEIMIEGAPRSGNTFAVAAFEFAQGRPVRIARHLHGAGHVIEGIRRQIPVLVVCRPPEASVTSQVIRHPETTLAQALRQYVTFHEPLLRHLDSIVVARFDEVITDFGAVIARVNQRFGTGFGSFEHTDENVARVFDRVDEMDRLDATRRSEDASHTTGRPVAARTREKDNLRVLLRGPELTPLLSRAQSSHDRFVRAT